MKYSDQKSKLQYHFSSRLLPALSLASLLLLITSQCSSQYVTSSSSEFKSTPAYKAVPTIPFYQLNNTADELLKKSKALKTAAWCFLSTGAVVMTVGIASYPKEGLGFFYSTPESRKKADKASIVTLSGFGLSLASVPFFIKARKDKRKATLAVSNQKTSFLLPSGYAKSITGITATFRISK